MSLRYLGFRTITEVCADPNHSGGVWPFNAGHVQWMSRWQRFRLGLLWMFGVDLSDLHVPLRSNAKEVWEQLEKARNDPEMQRLLDETFGDDE